MSIGNRFLRSRPAGALVLGGFVFAAVMAMRLAGLLQAFELNTHDWFLRLRSFATAGENRIVLIRIREEDIRRFGHPLSDELLTRVLTNLMRAEPRAVGIDLYRDTPVPRLASGTESSDSKTPAYRELGRTVAGEDRIVMVMKFGGDAEGGTPPPTFLKGTSQVGFSDFPVDPGETVRRSLLFLWDEETQHPSLSLQLALRYLREEGIVLERDPAFPNYVRLGQTTIPPFDANDGGYVRADDGGYQFLLDYRARTDSFPSFSLRELLDGDVPPEEIRDRIVIVGTTAPSVKDRFYWHRAESGDRVMYGIEVHAHATNQLLRFAHGDDRPIASMGESGEALWILCWALLGASLGLWNRSLRVNSLMALGGLGALFLIGFGFSRQSWWIPVMPPALAGLGSAGLTAAFVAVAERAERREVTGLFSRFVGPEVLREIWRQRDEFIGTAPSRRPQAQWLTLTVLMSDLEGFTPAAEKMDPYTVMTWVNEFATAMGDLIEQCHGVVDDYAGDGIKANFGFPVPRSTAEQIDSDAVNAVRCALAMGAKMERLNERWAERKLPTRRLRVGIFTGPAVAGVLGSESKLKYTSAGDTVNTAARLQDFEKDRFSSDVAESTWRVLIGDETLRRLGGAFRTEDLGLHSLRGKMRRIRIHRVLGTSSHVRDEPPEEVKL
jgi:adenylate cyclase